DEEAGEGDIISGGRLLVGVGAGWQQNEHEAYGIPFYTMRERLQRLDEACHVVPALWAGRPTPFEGRHSPPPPPPRRPRGPEARPAAPSRAHDRRRRREGHLAYRRQACRSLELLGRPAGP